MNDLHHHAWLFISIEQNLGVLAIQGWGPGIRYVDQTLPVTLRSWYFREAEFLFQSQGAFVVLPEPVPWHLGRPQ